MTLTVDAPTPARGLAASSMGPFEVLAQSLAGIAPSAVMATGPALVALGAGRSVLYSYAVSTVILLMVGWCITRFTKRDGGGTMLSYITSAFGGSTGFVGAVGLAFGYLFIAIGSLAGVALYVAPLLTAVGVPGASGTGVTLLLELLAVGLATFAMVRGVQLSTRIGVALEIVSVLSILVVIAAVLADKGLSAAPLHPAGLGVSNVTGGMVLAILGYVGFESAACMGTEAKAPGRTIPRAVLASVVIAGVLYLLSGYAQLIGFGDPAKLSGSAAPLNDLADAAGVPYLGYLIDLGAAASFFACVTGSLNAASRLLFSMGHERQVHRGVASAHPTRQTPHVAIGVLSVLAALITVTMTLSGITTINVFAYAGTIGTYGYMVAYILITLGLPVTLRRRGEPVLAAFVVGGLAAVGMLYVLFKSVYPVPAAPYDLLPRLFLGVVVVAVAWTFVLVARGRSTTVSADRSPEPAA